MHSFISRPSLYAKLLSNLAILRRDTSEYFSMLKSLGDHRAVLKNIAFNSFNYGFEKVGIGLIKKFGAPDNWPGEDRLDFIASCNEGFKIAQKQIVDEVSYYQTQLKNYTSARKDARRAKNKPLEKELTTNIEICEHRLKTLAHLADGIAWQLIERQIHVARRLYIQETENKMLDSSNLRHALEVAGQINEDPHRFALISDLTNFVQMGDLLVRDIHGFGILELKEGKDNEQIATFFKRLEDSGSDFSEIDLSEHFDETTIKQVKRVKRQKDRVDNLSHIVSNDEGIDPVSGQHITIHTPSESAHYYHAELAYLENGLKEKFWAYTTVDSIIHLGLYRDEGLAMIDSIDQILADETENYLVIDYMSIVNNVSEPIFAKPFEPETIIDILTGQKKLMIGLNLDKFISLLNDAGLDARWMSEKETTKAAQELSSLGIKGLFTIKKKGIRIKYSEGKEAVILGGVISKMLYDNITPMSIMGTLLPQTTEEEPEHPDNVDS